MKRSQLTAITVAIIMVVLISACASKAKSASGPEPTKSAEQKSEVVQKEAPPPPPAAVVSAEEVSKTGMTEEAKSAPASKPEPVTAVPETEPVVPAQAPEPVAPAPASVETHKGIDLSAFEIVHFNFDKYDILPEYRDGLAREAEILKSNGTRIVIEGYCDERGSAEYNMALGERRANSVKRYLVSMGVDKRQVGTISYGEERPADSRHNREAWRLNRRAQFSLAE